MCVFHTGSAAVAFMSYTMMENLLKPDFFYTSNDTIKTMMSTVISATLPKTTNPTLTKPVNFTFRHIRVRDSNVFFVLSESSQVTFIYIALLTIQIVSKHFNSIKLEDRVSVMYNNKIKHYFFLLNAFYY